MTMVNVLNDFCGFHAYPTVISCIIWASDLVGVLQGCHLNPPLFHFHSSVHLFSSVCIPVLVAPVIVTINNGTSVRHSVAFREFLSQKTRYLNVICSNPSPCISFIEGTKDLDFWVADASVLPVGPFRSDVAPRTHNALRPAMFCLLTKWSIPGAFTWNDSRSIHLFVKQNSHYEYKYEKSQTLQYRILPQDTP